MLRPQPPLRRLLMSTVLACGVVSEAASQTPEYRLPLGPPINQGQAVVLDPGTSTDQLPLRYGVSGQSLFAPSTDPLIVPGPPSPPSEFGPLIDSSLLGRPGLDPELPIERFRRSFYQGSEVLGGYLWDTGGGPSGLNQTFEEARVSFGLPLGSMDNILGMQPFFRVDHFDGPETIDLPGQVYNTGVNFLNQKQWSDAFSTTLILSPSARTDFESSDSAFRLFGLFLLNWQVRRDLKVSVGAVYFDRDDFNWLPAIGLIYRPTPWWKLDLTMPRPRLARRLWRDGQNGEGWAYIGGGIGGNTWAVQRSDGTQDELTVRAFELLAGYESIVVGNRGITLEAGYAMGRSIEYERQDIEIDLGDGVIVRANWRF
ncbi:hypothetical protein K227x_41950 [Rubripirellula lacrimiformis]|uniref:Uncharacterized protein n=1 Tax=Rubripirellula lacrimiformis TaxID=1930273 RepID=A0A517NF82_9BACT|nr:TonB-dependent receptor [Rubripirellula lacrimiformis]QDT05790.1 hypothetical protein K227x_41950 [Rubripirellula lacrimiformis]